MASTDFLTESLATWRYDRKGLIDEVENIRSTIDYHQRSLANGSDTLGVQRLLEVALSDLEDAVQVLEVLISTLPKGRESESVKALLDDALEALE